MIDCYLMETETIGDWLAKELQERGWDQAELVRRSGVSTAQISRIMSGTRRPGNNAMQGIARALKIPTEEVMRRAGILPKSGELLPEVRDWNERLMAIPAERRQEAVDALEGVLRALESRDRRPGKR